MLALSCKSDVSQHRAKQLVCMVKNTRSSLSVIYTLPGNTVLEIFTEPNYPKYEVAVVKS